MSYWFSATPASYGYYHFFHLYDFCLFALDFPCLFGLLVSFLLTSATRNVLSYSKKVFLSSLLYSASAFAIASLTASAWVFVPPPFTFIFMSTVFFTSPAKSKGSVIFAFDRFWGNVVSSLLFILIIPVPGLSVALAVAVFLFPTVCIIFIFCLLVFCIILVLLCVLTALVFVCLLL